MADLSQVMTTEELCTFFHWAHHLHDAEACLELAEMYDKCNDIEENKRSSTLWCRMARRSDNSASVKDRSSALMRTVTHELGREGRDCVERSLAILEYVLDDLGDVPRAGGDLELAGLGIENWERKLPKKRIQKIQPATLTLAGHGTWVYRCMCHSLSPEAWRAYLSAATIFDWKPQGAESPPYYRRKWLGSYYPAEHQEVTYEDARELRLALERMISAARSGDKMTEEQLEAVEVLQSFDKDLSGAQELADFALDGSFSLCMEPEWWP